MTYEIKLLFLLTPQCKIDNGVCLYVTEITNGVCLGVTEG